MRSIRCKYYGMQCNQLWQTVFFIASRLRMPSSEVKVDSDTDTLRYRKHKVPFCTECLILTNKCFSFCNLPFFLIRLLPSLWAQY